MTSSQVIPLLRAAKESGPRTPTRASSLPARGQGTPSPTHQQRPLQFLQRRTQ